MNPNGYLASGFQFEESGWMAAAPVDYPAPPQMTGVGAGMSLDQLYKNLESFVLKYGNSEAATQQWVNSLAPQAKTMWTQHISDLNAKKTDRKKTGQAIALGALGLGVGSMALGPLLAAGSATPGAASGGISAADAAAALGGAGEVGATTAGIGAADAAAALGGAAEAGAASTAGINAGVQAASLAQAAPVSGVSKLLTGAKTAADAASATGSLWGSLGAVGTAAAGLWNSYNSSQNVKDLLDASASARAGSMTVAGKQLAMADQNMIQQLALFDQVKPILEQQIKQATEASGLSTQRSNDLWAEYKTTWEPLGRTLAQKSLDWASPGRMESEAARAASDTKSQYDDAMTQSRRSLEMSGASQEKIAALEADARLKAAKAIGGAQSTARRETESKGMAYLDSATRLGLQIPQLGNQTGQLALSQAQQAQSGVGALTAATSMPISSTDALLRGANASYGTASGQALGAGALTLNNEAQKNAGYGDALQAGAKLIGLFGKGG